MDWKCAAAYGLVSFPCSSSFLQPEADPINVSPGLTSEPTITSSNLSILANSPPVSAPCSGAICAYVPPLLQYKDLKLDPTAHVVWQDNRRLELTGKEFGIIEYLLRHQGEIVSQETLLEHVWDMQTNPFTNTVRLHINSLRRKLEDMAETPRYIETFVGQGYRLGVPERVEIPL